MVEGGETGKNKAYQIHAVRLAWALVVVIFVSGVVGALIRGLGGGPDWNSFLPETRYFWEHGQVLPGGYMFGYLPVAYFALMPFTLVLPQPIGLYVYIGVNVLAAIGSLYVVWRWWINGKQMRSGLVWLVLLVALNCQHVFQLNQLTLWTLFLCVSGLALAGNGRQGLGGVLVGLAGLIKVMPMMMLGYFVFSRKWRAALATLATIVVFGVVPSMLVFGRQGTIEQHRAWLERSQWYSARAQISEPTLLGIYRHHGNFSYPAVLARWLRGQPDQPELVILMGTPPDEQVRQAQRELTPNEHLVRDPLARPKHLWDKERFDMSRRPHVSLARWPANVVWWIWAISLFIGLLALAGCTGWIGWRRPGDWASPGALWMLAMFWATPMMMNYYLVLALPAVAVLFQEIVRQQRWSAGRIMSAIAIVGWIFGEISLGWRAVRWYGVHFVVLGLLAAALMVMQSRSDDRAAAKGKATG
jgi:hypothetical protein